MKNIKLSEDEIKVIKFLVEKEKKSFEKDEKTIISDIDPSFLEGEVRNQEFLKNLLDKLK